MHSVTELNQCKNMTVDWWPCSEANWLNVLFQIAICSAGVGIALFYYLD